MNSWSPLYNIAETTNSIYSQHKKYTIYEDTSKLKMANLFIKSHELFPEKLMKMSGKKKKNILYRNVMESEKNNSWIQHFIQICTKS